MSGKEYVCNECGNTKQHESRGPIPKRCDDCRDKCPVCRKKNEVKNNGFSETSNPDAS